MILQDRGDHLVVIRQTDHALLSGYFAREWGNLAFQRPGLFESFCMAAAEHDNGWSEWEAAPRLDPKTRLPHSFMSVPTEEHIELYQRGIERVMEVDRYAGLLVSLHCADLYDRARATMPGFSAKYVKSSESQIVYEFSQRLKLQQLRLKVDLRTDPVTKSLVEEGALDASMRLLEALDRLSLYFCLGPQESITIEGIPFHREREGIDWQVRYLDEQSVSLAPYPFRKDPLPVSILARRVPKRLYADKFDFQRTLAGKPYFAMNFTLSAQDEAGRSRSAVA
jgi:Protein of unknown function (DUF3891)